LRSSSNGSAIASKSAFLKSNGQIVRENGTTPQIIFDVMEGYYFIVVNHRNHLRIMSKDSVQLNKVSSNLYDFTFSSDQYYGTSGAKELEIGVWGMYGGNAANINNMINVPDYSEVKSKFANTGYYNADTNLSGTVSVPDYSITKSNFAKTSTVP